MLILWEHACLRDFKWGSHASFWSKVSPSSFMLLTLFISTFSIYNFGIFWSNFCFLEKTIDLVLWGENLSPEFFDHIISSFRFVCSSLIVVFMFFPLHVRMRSSANRFPQTGGFILLIMSLMPIKNRVTLIADPCDTPFCIMVGLERCPLILTWMYLFFRKFFL